MKLTTKQEEDKMKGVVGAVLGVCGNASIEFMDTDRLRIYLPVPEGNGVWRWIICADEIESALMKLGYLPCMDWDEGWCEFVKCED